MSKIELPDAVQLEASAAVKFAAEKQGLSLHAVNVEAFGNIVARRVLVHATNSGLLVDKADHLRETDRLKQRARQFESYWASSTTSADAQLTRVQDALASIEDQVLAKRLADQIGVMLSDKSEP